MHILVTGGAGYIGSHTIIELMSAGYSVSVVDNLSNSSRKAIKRVEQIAGHSVPLHEFDLRNKEKLDQLFNDNHFDAVIHFAGLKAVGESVARPLDYYDNNIGSTIALLEVMQKHGVNKIVFSSSATVYGNPGNPKYTESMVAGIGITNPYGQTKFMIEQILRDLSASDPAFEVSLLRYFNPIGAHDSGLIGEDPHGIPNNLLPYISQVAVGKLDSVKVFGDDYDTQDGTGVRDYIHVVDLARGHVAALRNLKPGTEAYNLGSGKGTSVLELISAFSAAAGKKIPYQITERRAGDLACFYADPTKANRELYWKTEKSIEDACADTWRWQSQNPYGFRS